jgi:hypothetical protein
MVYDPQPAYGCSRPMTEHLTKARGPAKDRK